MRWSPSQLFVTIVLSAFFARVAGSTLADTVTEDLERREPVPSRRGRSPAPRARSPGPAARAQLPVPRIRPPTPAARARLHVSRGRPAVAASRSRSPAPQGRAREVRSAARPRSVSRPRSPAAPVPKRGKSSVPEVLMLYVFAHTQSFAMVPFRSYSHHSQTRFPGPSSFVLSSTCCISIPFEKPYSARRRFQRCPSCCTAEAYSCTNPQCCSRKGWSQGKIIACP